MKPFIGMAFGLILAASSLQATTHIVTNSSFSFSPSLVSIQLGDTVDFNLSLDHNSLEVSQATWNANGNAPLAGGFSTGFGGGIVVPTGTGTLYYVCSPHASIGMKGRITVNPVTDVDDVAGTVPAEFRLGQNYPNPFNPTTEIGFDLAASAFTEISVHDALGKRVRSLVSGTLPAARHTTAWDGLDVRGLPAGSGPYFVRMRARSESRDFFTMRKILLIR